MKVIQTQSVQLEIEVLIMHINQLCAFVGHNYIKTKLKLFALIC